MSKPANHMAVMAHRLTSDPDDPDFYPTHPWGARAGAEIVKRLDPRATDAWEPACGIGTMAHGLADHFPNLWTSDAYAYDGNGIFDFLADDVSDRRVQWVITNPPFGNGRAEAFVRRAHQVATRGVAMLMRVGMLESVGRHSLLYRDCPLTVFAPFSERLPLVKGRLDPDASSAAFYAWFIWLKPELKPRRYMARIGGEWFPATVPIPPGAEARLTLPSDARFAVRDRSRSAA